MTQYNKKKIGILLMSSLIIIGLLAHKYWSRNTTAGSDRIIANVEGCEITVDDFKEAARASLSNKYASADNLKTKFDILDDLITKKLLILEAQNKNFDKDAAFLKEIQHYWEQALIKRVLNEKLSELSLKIDVKDSEAEKEYARMRQKILAQTVILHNKKAAEELSNAADNFDETKAKYKDDIVLDEPDKWYLYGDLPRYIEDIVFDLKQGETSAPIAYGSNWMVVRVLGEEKGQIESFEKAANSIRQNIFQRKREELFEKWMTTLRSNSSIDISIKNLKKTEVK
ncbi:MAG: hypothetical protein A3G36_03440 [Omnitrophica bacterium RIFCSPLOWO2_12_FULL_45_13]|nr:MAG: hypothetical protein A3G36_03440 [Omnitrophica bacterium RIFCSPLOWO2_12_FULL_45_13]